MATGMAIGTAEGDEAEDEEESRAARKGVTTPAPRVEIGRESSAMVERVETSERGDSEEKVRGALVALV